MLPLLPLARLPFMLTIRPILEARERFERRTDRDFEAETRDNRGDLLSRYRLGAAFAKGPVKGELIYQYAHDESWNPSRNRALWRSDLVLANAEAPLGGGRLTFGRQRIRVGSERMLGGADWGNVSNSWDGLRYVTGRFESFAVKTGVNPQPNEEIRLVGATYRDARNTTLLVYKHDGRGAGIDEATLDHNVRLGFGKLGIDAEAAVQAGHRGGLRKLAGAVDLVATYAFAPHWSLSAQGRVASGGRDGDTTRTFDQLYAAVHDRHGLLDIAAWQNVRDLGFWLRFEPGPATSVKLQYHRLGLDSSRDAWYNANGRPNGKFNDPTGSHGRDLGDEYDIDFSHRLNRHQTLQGGGGLFRPGRYVRSFTDATKSQAFGYLQWQYRF